MRTTILALVLIVSVPAVAGAQTCNGQVENVLLIESSTPAGVRVADLVAEAGYDIRTMRPGEITPADLDTTTRIIVSSAQDAAHYEGLTALQPSIDAWLAADCCRVLQWHGHAGLDADSPGWHGAPAGLMLVAPAITFGHVLLPDPQHALLAGVSEPVTFPDDMPGARGIVDTDAATADIVIAEVEGGRGLLVDFEVGPSRILATTVHVESFATLQPALLDNLLAAQADEDHCDPADDDDDSASEDDDTGDDDDTTSAGDDDTTSADDDDSTMGDDDPAEAFEKCDTRDEYGLICDNSVGPGAAVSSLALIAWLGITRRRRAA
jgi:hypothetical protein